CSPSSGGSTSSQLQSHESQQLTCGFCGVKCTSLESHIRTTHLHHLLFAGLLQNTFYHAGLPNWPPLMPPPQLPSTTSPADLLQLHASLPNGSAQSPPSPKKPKLKSPIGGLTPVGINHSSSATPTPTTPTPPLQPPLPLPLLC